MKAPGYPRLDDLLGMPPRHLLRCYAEALETIAVIVDSSDATFARLIPELIETMRYADDLSRALRVALVQRATT